MEELSYSVRVFKKELISVRTKLNTNAHQNPETVNPGTNLSTIRITTALITSRKIPRESTVIGRVRKTRIGLINALRTPRTTATIRAVRKSSIFTPGRI